MGEEKKNNEFISDLVDKIEYGDKVEVNSQIKKKTNYFKTVSNKKFYNENNNDEPENDNQEIYKSSIYDCLFIFM